MHPELAECRFCAGCRYENKDYIVQDEHWLEDMGEMIAKAVEGMKKVPSYSACCHERLRATL